MLEFYHVVEWLIGPNNNKKADVLINHSQYVPSIADKYMVPGYKYIAIAREPVSWFKSAVKYYGSANQLTLVKGKPPVSIITVFTFLRAFSRLGTLWFQLLLSMT